MTCVEVMAARGFHLAAFGPVLRCRCPFHAERTGSFIVVAATDTFRCLCCGVHGGPDELERRLDASGVGCE